MHRLPGLLLILHCDPNEGTVMTNILQEELKVINIGIKQFMEALEEQQVSVVHVDWKPPTEEDEEIEKLLDSLL